ncbi:MAG: histidine phosphatase family protein [Dehalococcoidia bacterium]
MAASGLRVWLARHGETETNRAGVFCGHHETKLTSKGEEQARALGKRLAAVPVTAVVTSDLSRALATAALAAEGRGLTPGVDPDWREIHYGAWEGRREAEIRKEDPAQYALMRAESPDWLPPGGEGLAAVRSRMWAAFDRVIQAHKGGDVLVISHGTALSCLFAEAAGASPAHSLRFGTANCGLSRLEVHGGKVYLALVNDTTHLDGLGR